MSRRREHDNYIGLHRSLSTQFWVYENTDSYNANFQNTFTPEVAQQRDGRYYFAFGRRAAKRANWAK